MSRLVNVKIFCYSSLTMISKILIKKLKDDLEQTGKARSRIISRTHGLGREAKHVGFKLQRGEIKEAVESLKMIEKDYLTW